jgi:hypothetical protein
MKKSCENQTYQGTLWHCYKLLIWSKQHQIII